MNLRKLIHVAKEKGSATYSLQLGDCSVLPFKWTSLPARDKHLPLITDADIRQYIVDNSDVLYDERYCMHISNTGDGWRMEVFQTEFDTISHLTDRQRTIYNKED